MDRVIITGATGFIGKALCKNLVSDYHVIALSRNDARAKEVLADSVEIIQWDAKTKDSWISKADGVFGIINLAGENIASGRWSTTKKACIMQSRLDATKAVVDAIKQVNKKPKVVIQASAIGYYGPRADERIDEDSEQGEGFLAEVCQMSESTLEPLKRLGVRCVKIRTGIVLGKEQGALSEIIKLYRFFLGGYIGSGRQWFSWISLADEVAAIRFLIDNDKCEGVFNLTAPQPVRMKEFSRFLGLTLKKPAWIKSPEFVARFKFGEMADELLLAGAKVYPKRLLEAGFEFRHINIEIALKEILLSGQLK